MLPDLARLFDRDLQRLFQEIDAYADDETLWQPLPGTTNSGGNLGLHLVGNLNEYVGRIWGGIDYERDRPYEFSAMGLPKAMLLILVSATRETVAQVFASPGKPDISEPYPQDVLGYAMTVGYFLMHLHGHLNYHLGQINYHRRCLARL
jgi:DinB superfamily